MPRIKLTVAYDGTDYVGWQVQANGVSVQATLEDALGRLVGQRVGVVVAGRTDSGVHARGQVVAFDSPAALPLKAYWMGLNGLLPKDIAVMAAEFAPNEFDPRRWASGKRYQYQISNLPGRSPHRRRTHWEIFQPLDLNAMREGAQHLLGKHDFSSFRAADCQASHAVREIRVAEVAGASGDEIVVTFEGTAFLKHMVRNMVGTLVEVGRGRRLPVWVRDVLLQRDRSFAGSTAPPQGLFLDQIFYGDRKDIESARFSSKVVR